MASFDGKHASLYPFGPSSQPKYDAIESDLFGEGERPVGHPFVVKTRIITEGRIIEIRCHPQLQFVLASLSDSGSVQLRDYSRYPSCPKGLSAPQVQYSFIGGNAADLAFVCIEGVTYLIVLWEDGAVFLYDGCQGRSLSDYESLNKNPLAITTIRGNLNGGTIEIDGECILVVTARMIHKVDIVMMDERFELHSKPYYDIPPHWGDVTSVKVDRQLNGHGLMLMGMKDDSIAIFDMNEDKIIAKANYAVLKRLTFDVEPQGEEPRGVVSFSFHPSIPLWFISTHQSGAICIWSLDHLVDHTKEPAPSFIHCGHIGAAISAQWIPNMAANHSETLDPRQRLTIISAGYVEINATVDDDKAAFPDTSDASSKRDPLYARHVIQVWRPNAHWLG